MLNSDPASDYKLEQPVKIRIQAEEGERELTVPRKELIVVDGLSDAELVANGQHGARQDGYRVGGFKAGSDPYAVVWDVRSGERGGMDGDFADA